MFLSLLSKQSFRVRAGACVLRGLVSLREPQAPQGGLGGEANQKLFRQVAPPAMLARSSFCLFFPVFLFHFFRTFFASLHHGFCSLSFSSFCSGTGWDDGPAEIRQCGLVPVSAQHGPKAGCDAAALGEAQGHEPERAFSCPSVTIFSMFQTTHMEGVLMIRSDKRAMQPGRRPRLRAVLLVASVTALPLLCACSSTCHRHESASGVLDEQNVMLEKLKAERSDPRVLVKVQADPELKAAEEHLNMVIEMMTRSNGAVKAAL